jgi:glutathionyl-hydroquinone reductase
VVIARELKGLADVVGMSVVDPIRDDRGWAFRPGRGHGEDPVNGFAFLAEAYACTDPRWRGRVTVPVLWDTATRTKRTNKKWRSRRHAGEIARDGCLCEPRGVDERATEVRWECLPGR